MRGGADLHQGSDDNSAVSHLCIGRDADVPQLGCLMMPEGAGVMGRE